MTTIPPRVFVSYSHDTEPHKDWVLQLATRLVANGVDVILDQWDLTLGGDLPQIHGDGSDGRATRAGGMHRVLCEKGGRGERRCRL